MNRPALRIFWPLFWSLLGIAALTTLLAQSATAREVAVETLTTLFAIVTTPFILESTLAIGFLFALMLFNRWRLSKEGDGWVYLVSQEPEPDATFSPTTAQRLQGVLLPQEPAPLDEAQTERSLVEGYLELGMPAQALQELEAQGDLPDDAETALLRVRVLAANLETDAARALLHTVIGQFPERRALIAQAIAETCDWFAQHLPANADASAIWREEARALGVIPA